MATPLLRGLPDEIVVWEILVRLTPKDLLRCRPVCRSWRRATSTRRFLLAHHDRQPTLPLLYDPNSTQNGARTLGIIAFDHRAGLAATDRLQSVARLGFGSMCNLEACCDGLLVLFINDTGFCICNPATRQYAPLTLHHDFIVSGMYLHPPTGEYRLLLNLDPTVMLDELPPGAEYGIHVFTIGSSQPPRHSGYVEKRVYASESLMFRGRLHWWYSRDMIMVFDTIAESFFQMGSPVVPRYANLFETGGMLGMFSLNDEATVVDIWAMQDYESEVWAIKHRVELPFAAIRDLEMFDNPLKAVSSDGGVLVLVRFRYWLHHVDSNGKLVASFCRRDPGLTSLWLKQTLVSHTFFPTLEGYVVNALPFI